MVIPVVNRIEEEWTDGRVLRLNVIHETVKMYADSLQIKYTPTFILFDEKGREMKRWVGTAPELTDLPGG
jgi:thioredoxin-related protein